MSNELLVTQKQADLAARALLQVISKSHQSNLLPEEHILFLTIGLKKLPKTSKHPKHISLKHSLVDSETSEVCMFTKDPQDEMEQLVQKAMPKRKITVISVSKLREEYQSYESKRHLCASFDKFLCDDRILPLMPRLLSKKFYDAKKFPVPVSLARAKAAGTRIHAALRSTPFQINGVSIGVRVGNTGMSPKQIAENVVAVLEQAVPLIPGKAANVQGVFIAGNNTLALPLYQSEPTAADEGVLYDLGLEEQPAKRSKRGGDNKQGGAAATAAGVAGEGAKRKEVTKKGKKGKKDAANNNKDNKDNKVSKDNKEKKSEGKVEAAAKATNGKKSQQQQKKQKDQPQNKKQQQKKQQKKNSKEVVTTQGASDAEKKEQPVKGKQGKAAKATNGESAAKQPEKKNAAAKKSAASAPGSALKAKKQQKAGKKEAAATAPATPAKLNKASMKAKKTPKSAAKAKPKKTPKRNN